MASTRGQLTGKAGRATQVNQDSRAVETAEILRLHAAHKTAREIAETIGLHVSTVRKRIRAGVAAPPRPVATNAAVEARRWKAWGLRTAGASVAKVAEETGVNYRTAWDDLQWCRKQILDDAAAEARRLDLARIDEVIRSQWDRMLSGSDKAAAVVLRALQRRAEMYGYDAPKKVDLNVTEEDQVDRELAEMIREARARNATIEQQLRDSQK